MKTTASHTTTNVPQGPSAEPKGMTLRPLPAGPSPPPAWEAVPASTCSRHRGDASRPASSPAASYFLRLTAPPPREGRRPPDPASRAWETPTAWPGQGAGPSLRALGVSVPPAPGTCAAGPRAQSGAGPLSPREQLWSRVQELRGLRASCGTLPGAPGAPGWFDARAEQEGVETSAGGRQDAVQWGQARGAAGRHGE